MISEIPCLYPDFCTHEQIPDIKLNIQNREKQLFKSVLRVFQNTDTLSELLKVISKYVSQKRESNANTLHALLYRVIVELIRSEDSTELESGLVWEMIKSSLDGEMIKAQTFLSVDFGLLSQKDLWVSARHASP